MITVFIVLIQIAVILAQNYKIDKVTNEMGIQDNYDCSTSMNQNYRTINGTCKYLGLCKKLM